MIRHGYGRLQTQEGRIYEGYFVNDNLTGWGQYISMGNRRIYIGQFENSVAKGKGTMKYNNGKVEMGEFDNGVYIGKIMVNNQSYKDTPRV